MRRVAKDLRFWAVIVGALVLRLFYISVQNFGEDNASFTWFGFAWVKHGLIPWTLMDSTRGVPLTIWGAILPAIAGIVSYEVWAPTIAMSFCVVFAMVFFYGWAKSFFPRDVALFAIIFWGVSYWSVFFSTQIWNQAYLPLLMTILIPLCFELRSNPKILPWIVGVLVVGFQIHQAFLFIFPTVFLWWLIFCPKSWKSLLLALVTFVLLQFPYFFLYREMGTERMQLILANLQRSTAGSFSLWGNIKASVFAVAELLGSLNFGRQLNLSVGELKEFSGRHLFNVLRASNFVLIGFLILGVIEVWREAQEKVKYRFLLLFILGPIVSFAFLKGEFQFFYVLVLFPLMYLVMAHGLMVTRFFSRKIGKLLLVYVIVSQVGMVVFLRQFLKVTGGVHGIYGPTRITKELAVDMILEKTNGKIPPVWFSDAGYENTLDPDFRLLFEIKSGRFFQESQMSRKFLDQERSGMQIGRLRNPEGFAQLDSPLYLIFDHRRYGENPSFLHPDDIRVGQVGTLTIVESKRKN